MYSSASCPGCEISISSFSGLSEPCTATPLCIALVRMFFQRHFLSLGMPSLFMPYLELLQILCAKLLTNNVMCTLKSLLCESMEFLKTHSVLSDFFPKVPAFCRNNSRKHPLFCTTFSRNQPVFHTTFSRNGCTYIRNQVYHTEYINHLQILTFREWSQPF